MGLPVRKEIQREERDGACARFGLDVRLRTLVILGGSQGATALNDWARAQSVALARSGVQVYCVTGLGKTAGASQQMPVAEVTGQAIFSAFCDDMAGLMSAADLVVSRAGAGTLAELARCAAPAILVPYPHAADNHQQANAAEFARAGGGVVIEQTKMGELLPAVLALIHDEARLAQFHGSLAEMDRENSLGVLIDDLEEITGGYSESGPTGYRS
jgi:UDP-N-acetylglucosamine--N-acetylmuramyl-(pentapeptide) pyrophosphoryl-undecaprenol N-acetylglucosamine transferase